MVAAIFHLFTHAFFKALLFLAAGSVMHAMGNVIDMRRFSGLRKRPADDALDVPVRRPGPGRLPAPVRLLEQGRDPRRRPATPAQPAAATAAIYLVLFIVGLVTAGLTAFYTFRAYFLTFWGEERIPPEAGHHAHESPPVDDGAADDPGRRRRGRRLRRCRAADRTGSADFLVGTLPSARPSCRSTRRHGNWSC